LYVLQGSLFTWLTKIGQPSVSLPRLSHPFPFRILTPACFFTSLPYVGRRMLYLVLSIVCGSTTFLLLLIKNKTG
jgi:hypothetical protein